MKHFLIPILLLLALFTAADAQSGAIKTVSWNMEWFPGKRPTASSSEIAIHLKAGQNALKEMNPDVFIGVEITDWNAFHELCCGRISPVWGSTKLLTT